MTPGHCPLRFIPPCAAVVIRLLAIVLMAAFFVTPSVAVEARPLFAPVASVSLSVPASVQLGQDFTFTATFDNTGPSDDTGYGPFIDLIFPVIGVDGAGAATDDGIDFLGATFLGQPLVAVQLTFPSGGGGCVNHPYAVALGTGAALQVCGTAGDKLVVLQLPFGSFATTQPPAQVLVSAHLSNLADAGVPLTIKARGGFQYGATPINDWCCGDATILTPTSNNGSGWPSAPITPTLISLSKAYNGPENETATGSNYSRRYTITVDIADGQTVTDLDITDTLPANMAYLSVVSISPGSGSVTQSPPVGVAASSPNNQLVVNFPSITGGSGSSDGEIVFEYFIPERDASNQRVIDPQSGVAVQSANNASALGDWNPIDTRDPGGTNNAVANPAGPEHVLNDRSIAIQKSVSILTDVGASGYSPGDVLDYTLAFQVSDYFTFGALTVSDVLGDGQRLTGTPTLTFSDIDGSGTTSFTAGSDLTVDESQFPAAYGGSGACGDGTTGLTFDVSQAMLAASAPNGVLTGGRVNGASSGSATGEIHFQAVIQQDFACNFPSGDRSVDQGDRLVDNVTVNGEVYDNASQAPQSVPQFESDISSAESMLGYGILSKSIYAVNGSTSLGSPVRVKPGDTVTYHLHYTLPSSDFENVILSDFLPLPIFDATEITAFSNSICGIPAAGAACLGPGDAYHVLNGPPVNETHPVVVPSMTVDGPNNAVRFTYGDYDSLSNAASAIDLLFTVTVSNEPFADGLFLTNQAHVDEGTTNAGDQQLDGIIQIQISEPVLLSKKGVVATDNPAAVFSPVAVGPVTFNAPGTAGDRWSGTIDSAGLANFPINSNLSGVDAGDLVTFALTIENQGSSSKGAFDIAIKDSLPPGFVIPPSGQGLNLRVSYGDGTPITYTNVGGGSGLFDQGIMLDDPDAPAQGVCQVYLLSGGHNVIIITYDLLVDTNVTPGTLSNTSTLFNYASEEGGPDFTTSDLTDQADVVVITPPVKSLVVSSEASTSDSSNPPRVTIGEIIRYRLQLVLPEGQVLNLRLHDNLPNGLTFINDNTAKVAFVSDDGGACHPTVSSSTLGSGPWICGDESSIGTIAPSVVLPDTAVSASDSTAEANYSTENNDAYSTGADVYFKLGTLTNTDSDNDLEYVVIEFNALLDNTAAGSNDAGENRDNLFDIRTDATSNAINTSNSFRIRIAEPSITNLDKAVRAPAPHDAGDTVLYRITFSNATGVNRSTAFDVHLTDTLQAELTLNLASIVVTLGGGSAGPVNASAGNSLDITIESMPPGGTVQVDFSATLNINVAAGQAISNTANLVYTSLPGDNGTIGNPTGSDNTGLPGSDNGERDGSGGRNDYFDSDTETFNIDAAQVSKAVSATSNSGTGSSQGNPAFPDLAMGETATFLVTITVPEGTTPLVLTDNLPTVNGVMELLSSQVLSIGSHLSGSLLLVGDSGTASDSNLVDGLNDRAVFNFGTLVNTPDGSVTDDDRITLQLVAGLDNLAANQNTDTLTNTAILDYGVATSSASAGLDVVEPVLQVAKLPSDATPFFGQTVTYTITLQHAAASRADAHDVTLQDVIPAGLTYVSGSRSIMLVGGASGGADVSSGSTMAATITSLPMGGSVTLTYQAEVDLPPPNAIGNSLTNAVASTWTSLPGIDVNERTGSGGVNDYRTTTSAPVLISGADLSIDKSDGGAGGVPGGDIDYSLTYANTGNDAAEGVVISETVPVYTSFNAAASTPGWNCVPDGSAGNPCSLSLGVVPAGSGAVAHFVLTVIDPLPAGVEQVDNTASIADDGGSGPDTTPGDNQSSDSTPLTAAPELAVVKDDGLDVVAQGSSMTYQLLVSNLGNQDATGVTVNDRVPPATTFQPGSSSAGWACAPDNGPGSSCLLTIGDLAAGDSVTISFTLVLDDPLAAGISQVDNQAVVGDDGSNGTDSNPNNNQDDDLDAVIRAPEDLTKTLADTSQTHTSGLSVAVGEILTYQLSVTIPSNATINSLRLTDELGAGLAFVNCQSIVPGNGLSTDLANGFDDACQAPANPTVGAIPDGDGAAVNQGRKVTFDFGQVRNGQGADADLTIRYLAVVLDASQVRRGSTHTNGATLTWQGGQLAIGGPTVRVVEPDLSLAKAVSPSVAAPGGRLTFTLDIAQTAGSDSDAFDLRIVDTLPDKLGYVPGSLTWSGIGVPPDILDDSALPNLLIGWDAFPLGSDSRITFQADILSGSPGTRITNSALLEWTSLPDDNVDTAYALSDYNALSTERYYDPNDAVNVYGVTGRATVRIPLLPETGFTPGSMTELPEQPAAGAYQTMPGMRLLVPALGLDLPVVGVPAKAAGWDLTWLGAQAGYLEGTAYPTFSGNTALTAHVTLPSGLPGPFSRLGELAWGDRIILQVGGLNYIYEVRQVRQVSDRNLSVLGHKAEDWLTLITCDGYDDRLDRYRYRLAVQAVRLSVETP
jgi:LPXTG-site transpeptidase (sortase) family protein